MPQEVEAREIGVYGGTSTYQSIGETLVESRDLEVQDPAEDEQNEPPIEYSIKVYPADFTLEVLHNKINKETIIFPEFQRNYVWNIRQASRLIESFIIGLPVPQIFLYTDENEKLRVIDGRQRLQSIHYFFKGTFIDSRGTEKKFRLDGLNKHSLFFEKSFEDLSSIYQERLQNAVLRAMIVDQLKPDDTTSMYHIFERLNTGGTKLTDQEVRNAVYHGSFSKFLNSINTYPNWRAILGKQNPDQRQKDTQLILRYMSLYHESENYTKPMRDFLSTFMKKYRKPDKKFLKQEKKRFETTCDLIVEHLGIKRPLNPSGSLNAAVFDSIFVSFAKNHTTIPDNIKVKIESLITNKEFVDLVDSATTDPPTVRKRLEMANSLFV